MFYFLYRINKMEERIHYHYIIFLKKCLRHCINDSFQDVETKLVPGHDGLSIRADVKENLQDLGFKAHIEHPVSLVQHL